jgi:exodeoxyribonuclease VII large subunit
MDDTDTTSNAPAFSVSELAFALKRTLEDAYGFVRLRGELSKVTHHASGHVYLTLKDDKAAIDGVIWKGSARAMAIRPEQGMEVVVTGKITTFPAGSRYQIVIDRLEPAGIGALLAQLERLKTKLDAEGLFSPARKKPLPAMPGCIAVITSPTGAVIRDILHRLRERWPCQVIVWPVVVQGDQAAAQVTNAIKGLNQDTPHISRPDIIIVARGGGSVEDLWPFNDETLARAVAASDIPIISAVGHETDTTLIDFVADRRAPTPTAAAEMATPVLLDLKAAIAERVGRLGRAGARLVEDRRNRLAAVARGLPRASELLGSSQQRLDSATMRLGSGLKANANAHERDLVKTGSRLRANLILTGMDSQSERLLRLTARNLPAIQRQIQRLSDRLTSLDLQRKALDPDRPLRSGFARIHAQDGKLVRSASQLVNGDQVKLVFSDASKSARIEDTAQEPSAQSTSKPSRKSPKPSSDAGPQGSLF